MFHRKRFRLAMVIVLTLLLTAALAPAASAATPPPTTIGAGGGGGTPEITLPPQGDGSDGGNGNGDNGMTDPPDPNAGNGDNGMTMPPGNGDDGMMVPPPDSWPPPNAIVHHAATPVQISAISGGLNVYLIHPDGTATPAVVLASLSSLAEMHPSGGAVELYSGTNPGSGKPVTIEYLPAEMKIRVRTFYADKPPHDFDKAYIFTVDADHSVTHERW